MGRASSLNNEASSRGTPASAKIIMLLQAIVIGFLSFWAFEEYQNNLYFQAYVNSTVQANRLALGLVIGIPVFAVSVYAMIRVGRRGERLLSVEPTVSVADNRRTVLRSDVKADSSSLEPHGSSSEVAEMAARFLKQAGPITGSSDLPLTRGRMPVLERVEPAPAPRVSVPEKLFPVLERLEPRQERVEPGRDQVDNPVFHGPQGPQPVPLRTVPGKDQGFSPQPQQPPRFSGPIPGPVPGRPSRGVPMVRPPTVVTGIIGQGPRPLPQGPQQGQGPMAPGQRPEPRLFSQNWTPGVRPENSGEGQRDKPSPYNPPVAPSSGGSGVVPIAKPVLQAPPPPALGRVRPVQSASEKLSGEKPPPGLGRVEPVQAVASKLPWLKTMPPANQDSPSGHMRQRLGTDSEKSGLKPAPFPGLERAVQDNPSAQSPQQAGIVSEKQAPPSVAQSSQKPPSASKKHEHQENSEEA